LNKGDYRNLSQNNEISNKTDENKTSLRKSIDNKIDKSLLRLIREREKLRENERMDITYRVYIYLKDCEEIL
jgi:ferredoxin-fold anticodon binding domain-containing protein